MANRFQPVKCMPLWNPPEQEIVCKLISIRLLFLEKLGCLCGAFSDIHPSQEDILNDILTLTERSVNDLNYPLVEGTNAATMYLYLLHALKKKRNLHLFLFYQCALGVMQAVEWAQLNLKSFRDEFKWAICQVTIAGILGGEVEGALKTPIAELFGTIDEYDKLLQEYSDIFSKMKREPSNGNVSSSHPPSEKENQVTEENWITFVGPPSKEEIQVTEEKWIKFVDATKGPSQEYDQLSGYVRRPSFWQSVFKCLKYITVKFVRL